MYKILVEISRELERIKFMLNKRKLIQVEILHFQDSSILALVTSFLANIPPRFFLWPTPCSPPPPFTSSLLLPSSLNLLPPYYHPPLPPTPLLPSFLYLLHPYYPPLFTSYPLITPLTSYLYLNFFPRLICVLSVSLNFLQKELNFCHKLWVWSI